MRGGFAANRIHLIEGEPGAGKTTLGIQFLLEGKGKGERCLYVTLSEGRDELINVADTHGWDMNGIDIFELVPPELSLDPEREQSILYASDLELGETVRLVMEEVDRVAPARAFARKRVGVIALVKDEPAVGLRRRLDEHVG